ncbi:hypothetical protein [Deefgea sp. CFH1-16]|uniref:hypothetical protein n=1 Tax=Deefgea sp. CFH1-16 TaxID=2675457 RepID=UPI001940308A|nr:hypothetical protein [Deefgea sp. CFH1-16]
MMFKFATKASILILSAVALISLGMPIQAQAKGDHQKGARPAASKKIIKRLTITAITIKTIIEITILKTPMSATITLM